MKIILTERAKELEQTERTLYRKENEVKELLKKQVSSSVRWEESVEKMIENGVDTFVEIGPGKTLSNLIKKINREVTVINIEKVEDLDKLREICE